MKRYKMIDFSDEKIIGRGGFAKVLSATEKSNGKEVCLKTIKKSRQNLIDFFRREKKYMETLPKNDNIVRYFGYIEESNTLVMELLDMDMEQLCQEMKDNLKCRESCLVILHLSIGVTNGLIAMSEVGLAHTDLDIKNILIDTNKWIAKIADFGLCRANIPEENSYNTTSADRMRVYLIPLGKLSNPTEYQYTGEDDVYQFTISLVRAFFTCLDIDFEFTEVSKTHVQNGNFIETLLKKIHDDRDVGEDVKNLMTTLISVYSSKEVEQWTAKSELLVAILTRGGQSVLP